MINLKDKNTGKTIFSFDETQSMFYTNENIDINDYDDIFEDFKYELQSWITEYGFEDKVWIVAMLNFGWTKKQGTAIINADSPLKFLHGILPNTQCTYRIYTGVDEFSSWMAINNAHHDSPMLGGDNTEWYIIRPYKE